LPELCTEEKRPFDLVRRTAVGPQPLDNSAGDHLHRTGGFDGSPRNDIGSGPRKVDGEGEAEKGPATGADFGSIPFEKSTNLDIVAFNRPKRLQMCLVNRSGLDYPLNDQWICDDATMPISWSRMSRTN